MTTIIRELPPLLVFVHGYPARPKADDHEQATDDREGLRERGERVFSGGLRNSDQWKFVLIWAPCTIFPHRLWIFL